MSHRVIIVTTQSVLEVFDPNDPEYAGVREHFSTHELEKIDELRARDPETGEISWKERFFIHQMLGKLLYTAD